jgi:hypothetical protein
MTLEYQISLPVKVVLWNLIVPQSRHARLFRKLLWKRLNDEGHIACICLPLVMKQLDWDGQKNIRTIYRPADPLRLRLTWKTSETVTTFLQMVDSRKSQTKTNFINQPPPRHIGTAWRKYWGRIWGEGNLQQRFELDFLKNFGREFGQSVLRWRECRNVLVLERSLFLRKCPAVHSFGLFVLALPLKY